MEGKSIVTFLQLGNKDTHDWGFQNAKLENYISHSL